MVPGARRSIGGAAGSPPRRRRPRTTASDSSGYCVARFAILPLERRPRRRSGLRPSSTAEVSAICWTSSTRSPKLSRNTYVATVMYTSIRRRSARTPRRARPARTQKHVREDQLPPDAPQEGAPVARDTPGTDSQPRPPRQRERARPCGTNSTMLRQRRRTAAAANSTASNADDSRNSRPGRVGRIGSRGGGLRSAASGRRQARQSASSDDDAIAGVSATASRGSANCKTHDNRLSSVAAAA